MKERKERKKTIVTLPQIIDGQVWRYKEVRDSKEKQPLLSFFLQATILLHIYIYHYAFDEYKKNIQEL